MPTITLLIIIYNYYINIIIVNNINSIIVFFLFFRYSLVKSRSLDVSLKAQEENHQPVENLAQLNSLAPPDRSSTFEPIVPAEKNCSTVNNFKQ